MKPFQVILIIILALVLIVFLVRSCQDDVVYEPDYKETTESDASEDEKPFVPPFVEQPVDSVPSQANNSAWPDSIFKVVDNVKYLSQIDKDVIIELNKCRTNPSRYAEEVLIPFLNQMSSTGMFVDSQGLNIKTDEGKAAIEEAINALNAQKPLSMLHPRQYLCLAAADHCADQGHKSLVGHGGSDGSSPTSRAKRHNSNCRGIGENIDYGCKTASEIIRSLIVDDGVPGRGHRDNIFHDYNFVGSAFGHHKAYRYMCVLDFE